MKTQITIQIDTARLGELNDETLSAYWHTAQVNPVPFGDRDAGELVESIGREIICRWLNSNRPPLWHHSGSNHFWNILQQHGKWIPVNGDETNRQWAPNPPNAK